MPDQGKTSSAATRLAWTRGWCLLIALWILAASCRVAAAPLPRAVDLAKTGEVAALTDHLWLFREIPGEPRAARDLLGTAAWEPTSAENLSSAYRPATVWLLGAVHNSSTQPLSRWITVLPWQLRDVQFFLMDPATGAILEQQRAGLDQPRSALAVDTAHPTFPIVLAPGQTRTLLLRVEDRSFLGLRVHCVEPTSHAEQETRVRDRYLIFAGFALAIAVLLLPLGLILGVILLDRLDRRQSERARERALVASQEAARQALIDQQREENLRLMAAVEQQTRSLREATARAEQSSQAKSAFLSTVSHELRAPLHDILGYAQLLTRQVTPQGQSQLAVIQESGQQLLHLINDILDFSRAEAKPIQLDPGPLSLSRLARHLTEIYRPRAVCIDNRLITRIETGDIDWVLADERRLTQVLRNLLENACKFTQGGQIELGIALIEPPRPIADGTAPRCLIELSVTDNGTGIPEDQQARLFEPFARLERDQRLPGLGLGLPIAQQLVQAMGGWIRLTSRQGEQHGSRFSFRLSLPLSAPSDLETEGTEPIIGYQGRRRTLLIADDFPTSRGYLADCADAWGFEVILVEDGVQALARLREAGPPVDAVLIDQYMPRLDGWGFLARLRETESTADIPVVLISAAPPQRPDAFPPELTFDAYAMKPLSESSLARILSDLLGLDWVLADEPPATLDTLARPALPAMPPPGAVPSEQIEAFERMLALGQLIAIEEWARTMANRYPDYEPFWQDILNRCTTVDLPGLRQRAAAWMAGSPGSAKG